MRRVAAVVVTLLLASGPAQAGAWTLDQGKVQVFTGMTASTASRRFDNGGSASTKIIFRKLLFQNWTEVGLTDAVTLFAAPEYVMAKSGAPATGVSSVSSMSLEGGVRILLLSRIGMLSVQGSAKSAGAFDMSTSSSGESGRQFEARLLYGRSFKLLGNDGFFDLAAAERWIARPRPDEFAFDATTGWWLTPDYLVLIQSFNVMTAGGVKPPYEPYRLHKLQFSLVSPVTKRWSIQSGYFFSIAGRNIVKETGVVTTFWYQT